MDGLWKRGKTKGSRLTRVHNIVFTGVKPSNYKNKDLLVKLSKELIRATLKHVIQVSFTSFSYEKPSPSETLFITEKYVRERFE